MDFETALKSHDLIQEAINSTHSLQFRSRNLLGDLPQIATEGNMTNEFSQISLS
jgi:hypothetical protein